MNGGHATTGLDLFVGGHVFDERGENIGPKQGLVFHYGTSVTRRRDFGNKLLFVRETFSLLVYLFHFFLCL